MTTSMTTQPARPALRHRNAMLGFVAGAALAGSIAIGVGLAADDDARPADRPASATSTTPAPATTPDAPASVGGASTSERVPGSGCVRLQGPC